MHTGQRSPRAGQETAPLPGAEKPITTLGPGTLVGRYVVVEPLGSGGGGAVYAAYDAHLGRRVAIKVLATRAESSDATWGRVISEAQLIARLDHPNVVTVHDVGVADDRAFIAMELVDGTDLQAWLGERAQDGAPARTKARIAEVLQPFMLAGRGLAAAHARQVIHGDFKPANVLVGKDGRVRVTDFGIAHLQHGKGGYDEQRTDPTDAGGSWRSTATAEETPHKLWGTPLYMAPELFDGQRPNEASDVYAFCASLYEALYDQPPARGRNLMALYAAKLDPPAAPRSAVPRRVRDIVLAGLSPLPAARPRSVALVVDSLERALRPRHRGPAWAGGALVVSTGFAILGAQSWQAERSCVGAERHLAGIWDDATEQSVHDSMLATGLPYAADTWDRLERQLDNYASTWVGVHTETCLATQRGEQSEQLLDRKMMCLEERRVELSSLVEVLQRADADAMENALDASASLRPPAECQDFRRLDVRADASPDAPRLRQEIARARTLVNAGRSAEARQTLLDVRLAASETGDKEAEVDALRWLGEVEARQGHPDAAVSLLENATMTAEVEKIDDVAARAGVSLLQVLVAESSDSKKAEQWVPHVDVAVRRAGSDPMVRFAFFHARGVLAMDQQRYDDALADLRRAEDLLADMHDPRLDRANLANAYGLLYSQRGELDLAEQAHREALALHREVRGDLHPAVAKSLDNLASVLHERGSYEEALAMGDQALLLMDGAFGRDHPAAITVRANQAGALAQMGRSEEAASKYREVIAAYERAFERDHPYAAGARLNLAGVLGRMGEYEEAIVEARRGLPVIEAKLGENHPWVAYALINVGTAQKHLLRTDEAILSLERAIPILQPLPGQEHQIALAQIALAEALFDADRDHSRAIELARAALAQFPADSEDAARTRSWLAAHGH